MFSRFARKALKKNFKNFPPLRGGKKKRKTLGPYCQPNPNPCHEGPRPRNPCGKPTNAVHWIFDLALESGRGRPRRLNAYY